MGSQQTRRTKAMREGLGWLLRAHYDGLAREPLPERWIELINCLDERERVRLKSKTIVQPDQYEFFAGKLRARFADLGTIGKISFSLTSAIAFFVVSTLFSSGEDF